MVITGDGLCLLGRNWLQHLTLNWWEIKAVSQYVAGSLDYLFDKYRETFAVDLGMIKSFSAELHVKLKDKPKFFKS